MLPERLTTSKRLAAALLLLIVVIVLANQRGDARAAGFSLCALPYSSVSVVGVGRTSDSDVLDAVAAWELDASEYEDASGRPLNQLNFQTDGTRQGRIYSLVYADRMDAEQVVVFTYSYERLFGRHTDPDLHNHPDLCAGSMARANLDALLSALE